MEMLDQCRERVFRSLWQYYYDSVPIAARIESALKARSDAWIEDHVAFRTLPGEHTGAHVLQGLFEALGYVREDDYHFEEKKLNAFWLSPPDKAGSHAKASPKIFVSELILDDFSDAFKQTLTRYTNTVNSSVLEEVRALTTQLETGIGVEDAEKTALYTKISDLIGAYLTASPAWFRPSLADYKTLAKESEYAAWTLLFANKINHFTVSVHLMDSFETITELGSFLETDLGIGMNHSGGLVKGNPSLKLEQIATMAVKVPYLFQDGLDEVPYGFVEFAKRYPLDGKASDGNWHSYYQGFVTANADKIFESTMKTN